MATSKPSWQLFSGMGMGKRKQVLCTLAMRDSPIVFLFPSHESVHACLWFRIQPFNFFLVDGSSVAGRGDQSAKKGMISPVSYVLLFLNRMMTTAWERNDHQLSERQGAPERCDGLVDADQAITIVCGILQN